MAQALEGHLVVMRIVATADLHGHLPEIPPCDLLLIAGDVCPVENHGIAFQRQWVNHSLVPWIKGRRCQAEHIVWIAGNHDLALELGSPGRRVREVSTYLQDSAVEIEGLVIYGTPWSEIIPGLPPSVYPWAFSLWEDDRSPRPGLPAIGLRTVYSRIPHSADIVLVHGPPRGYGDATWEPARPSMVAPGVPALVQAHKGSPSLLARLEVVKPQLCVFGHIHEGYGQYEHQGIGLINASLMNEDYEPVNPPMIVEL